MAELFTNVNILAIMDDEVFGFIERSIVDIARKCHVDNTFVIQVFKEKFKIKDNEN